MIQIVITVDGSTPGGCAVSADCVGVVSPIEAPIVHGIFEALKAHAQKTLDERGGGKVFDVDLSRPAMPEDKRS